MTDFPIVPTRADVLRNQESEKDFSKEDYVGKRESFGTIILESNRDMDLQTAYDAYSQRWQIELVFRYYKDALGLDETRVEGNVSVIGSEFVDFLSTLITSRMIARMEKAGLLNDDSFHNVMADLNGAMKVDDGRTGWQFARMNPRVCDMLAKLNLAPKIEKPPERKRGRPRKNPQ